MNAIQEPNWAAATSELIEESVKAIESFGNARTDECCSCFAFSADYCFGNIAICFDTLKNSLAQAKRNEARILGSRDSALSVEKGWESAKYYLLRERLCAFNSVTANFRHPEFSRVHFSDWEDYFLADHDEERPDPIGHVIVLMHNTIRELVSSGIFARLQMSSPFHIGVEFPEDMGFIVVRLLNW